METAGLLDTGHAEARFRLYHGHRADLVSGAGNRIIPGLRNVADTCRLGVFQTTDRTVRIIYAVLAIVLAIALVLRLAGGI